MSIGGGGEKRVSEAAIKPREYKPEFYETPREWVTPPTEVLTQQMKDIGQQTGYGTGRRNLFGSGIMGEAIARRMSESAIRGTRREDKGQWIRPQVVTPSTKKSMVQAPSWGVSVAPGAENQ